MSHEIATIAGPASQPEINYLLESPPFGEAITAAAQHARSAGAAGVIAVSRTAEGLRAQTIATYSPWNAGPCLDLASWEQPLPLPENLSMLIHAHQPAAPSSPAVPYPSAPNAHDLHMQMQLNVERPGIITGITAIGLGSDTVYLTLLRTTAMRRRTIDAAARLQQAFSALGSARNPGLTIDSIAAEYRIRLHTFQLPVVIPGFTMLRPASNGPRPRRDSGLGPVGTAVADFLR